MGEVGVKYWVISTIQNFLTYVIYINKLIYVIFGKAVVFWNVLQNLNTANIKDIMTYY